VPRGSSFQRASWAAALLAACVDGPRPPESARPEPREAPNDGPSYQPPSYVSIERVTERGVTVGHGRWALGATLSLATTAGRGGRALGLLLVAGSGPSDRDGSVGPNKPMRDIALGLATRGIAVLRYDKRTHAHADAVAAEIGAALTLREETIDDALAAVAALRRQPEVDPRRIFVLGHSLGALALPRILEGDRRIAGGIVLAGPTTPFEDAVVRQLEHVARLDGRLSARERALIDELERQAARVKALDQAGADPPGELPLGLPPAFWRDLAAHPPLELIQRDMRPLFVLHADRDYQVTLDDFRGWERALGGRKSAVLKRYPALDHLFMRGAGPASPADYRRPGHVAGEVIDDIAAWLEGAALIPRGR
jgi:dienelactone hydrolase